MEPHSRYDSAPSPIIIIIPALLLGFKFVIKLKRSNRILKEISKIMFLCLNWFFFFSSLLEAIDLIVQGAQNLVVPIQSSMSNISRRKLHQKPQIGLTTMHKGCEYCWLTQEDVVRYLLSSIGLFSPVAALLIGTLGIIDADVLAIDYHSPASSSLPAILRSLRDQTSVAVLAMLSSGDLMAYINCGGPPEEIVRMVKTRLKQRNLEGMLARKMARYM